MFKVILSLTFAALTILSAAPVLADDLGSDEQICLDRAGVDAIADLTSATQVNCSSDWDCGYGNICDYNQCRPAQCFSDNQCFSWEECDNGRCQRDPWATTCQVDTDCFGARYCRLGYCKRW